MDGLAEKTERNAKERRKAEKRKEKMVVIGGKYRKNRTNERHE